ncbi:hypothetical protein EDD21DRAFT_361612 [Dissophora ornata]|nr:hypothetical protein BGZ58_009399 [Dissophora ornata]KAI8606223.1 hypothetical protein EDD21DRAFT_361612 [Dissophora ornata]
MRLALAAILGAALFFAAPASAAPDAVIETCASSGCTTVSTILAPCGGGASNSSLQQDVTYTVTPDLGSCECNSEFYNAFALCLACISSQGKSSPEIDSQQNWAANCKTYGFNYTDAPINYTAPITGGSSSSGGGISTGAVVGIVIVVLVVAALAGAFFFLRNRKKRTKGGIFERPYTSASSGTGGSYAPTPTQPTFNAYSSYNNTDYPDTHDGYANQDQSYYGYGQDQEQHYSSDQNDESMAMTNLQHSAYIAPPVPMTAAAVAAVGEVASPRPSDAFPQSLRNKGKDWEDRQNDYVSGLVSSDQLLHNDKAVYDDGEELEPPRSRDRFVNDRDDFTQRRSLTPPRANMQSYRDEFTRPSFDREPRRNSGSEPASLSGLNLARGTGTGGYDSNDEDGLDGALESPESARRRRAAELFSSEGTRR